MPRTTDAEVRLALERDLDRNATLKPLSDRSEAVRQEYKRIVLKAFDEGDRVFIAILFCQLVNLRQMLHASADESVEDIAFADYEPDDAGE